MIAFNELIKNISLADIPIAHQQNLEELLKRINIIRTAWNNPMTVTSGYRTTQDQLRIYRAKGIADNKIPMGSQHLKGAAVDILDTDKKLQEWCLANEALLEETGLWMESFEATPDWVHFQIYPPKSGNRWFKP